MRDSGQVQNRAIYLAIGIKMDGTTSYNRSACITTHPRISPKVSKNSNNARVRTHKTPRFAPPV
jgi:hypothetical protein